MEAEIKENDSIFVNFKSAIGVELRDTTRFNIIEYTSSPWIFKAPRQIKQQKLIQRLQRIKSVLNIISVAFLLLVSFIIIFSLVITLSSILNNTLITTLLTWLGCLLMVYLWDVYTDLIECDSNLISVNHKGKKYHYLDFYNY